MIPGQNRCFLVAFLNVLHLATIVTPPGDGDDDVAEDNDNSVDDILR